MREFGRVEWGNPNGAKSVFRMMVSSAGALSAISYYVLIPFCIIQHRSNSSIQDESMGSLDILIFMYVKKSQLPFSCSFNLVWFSSMPFYHVQGASTADILRTHLMH